MASRFDEIVADSEDEDMLVNTSFDVGNGSAGLSPKTADTSIYASDKNPQAPLSQPPIAVLPEATASSSNASQDARPTKTTAATSRSAGPTVPSVPSVPADGQARPKPRPRPRPAYKGAPGREDKPATPQAASLAPSPIDSFPSSVAATRLPPPQPSDPIVSSSSASVDKGKGKAKATVDDIESFGMDIAERAKMRTAKKKKPLPVVNDIIELTSDSEDELSLLPPPKPKPKKATEKPKPKPKLKIQDVPAKSPRKKAKLSHDLPDSTPVTIPVPTSDIAPSSQLPPSDPLLPSSAPIPPASTPPRNNSPPSSPFPAPIRKRKRPNNSVLSDNEDADSRRPVQPTASTSSAILMPPPPPPAFFASPSPSPPRAVLPQTAKPDATDVEAEPKKKAARKKKNADDEDEDWDAKPKPKAKTKPKATKKKVQEDAEEAPTEKPKPPSKAKGRGRKKMEVIVEVTSPKKPAKPRSPSPLADRTMQLPPAEPPAGESSELSALESEHERPLPKDVPLPASPPPRKPAASSSRKGKKRAIVSSDEEDEGYQDARPSKKGKAKAQDDEREGSEPETPQSARSKSTEKLGRTSSLKENGEDSGHTSSPQEPPAPRTPAPKSSNVPSSSSSSARRTSSIIPKKSNVPMSELLRKVNSLPGSPFASQRPTHSPYMKASKSALRRIAPLLTSRRTPPPPPPRPPPPKKTKKQLELEEKWEMELEESVDGWYCLPEDERAALRRAKRDREMGFDD